MLIRVFSPQESWNFLRLAIRKWAVHDLPANTEVGLVSANDSSANRLHGLSRLQTSDARDQVASNIPYSTGDSRPPACLACAFKEAIQVNIGTEYILSEHTYKSAERERGSKRVYIDVTRDSFVVFLQMLETRANVNGPASSVIVVIAPGTATYAPDLARQVAEAKEKNIRIATVTYPMLKRLKSLDWMAEKTGGVSFTVTENKYNMALSYLSTYFQLTNVMRNIMETYYQGNKGDLPVEIHRRELTDGGRTGITGSFVLEDHMGEPARFTVYTHNTENPLIRAITLTSPSHKVYTTRSDSLLSLKMLSVPAAINEVNIIATANTHNRPVFGPFFSSSNFKKKNQRFNQQYLSFYTDRNLDVPDRTVPGKSATALCASDGQTAFEKLARGQSQGLDERNDESVGHLCRSQTRRVSGAGRQGRSVGHPTGFERFERAPRKIRSLGHRQRRSVYDSC